MYYSEIKPSKSQVKIRTIGLHVRDNYQVHPIFLSVGVGLNFSIFTWQKMVLTYSRVTCILSVLLGKNLWTLCRNWILESCVDYAATLLDLSEIFKDVFVAAKQASDLSLCFFLLKEPFTSIDDFSITGIILWLI